MLFLELRRLTALEHHALLKIQCLKKVVPDDFRLFAGNHGNDTESARKVENVYEAQLVASIIRKHEQINGCCVTKLSVCAKSCRQVGSRTMLTLAHIKSLLWCCAKCSCAATSDTYGSGECMVGGVTQICVHLAKTCRQPLLLLLGGQCRLQLVSGSSSNSRGRKCLSWCPGRF